MPPTRTSPLAPSPTRAAIARAMDARDISGRELARRTGTTPAQVTEFLAGRRDPTISTVERWMRELNLIVTLP